MTVRIDGTNTSAAPGITGADTDTGLKFGTNEVDIVTGGTDRVIVDSSGNVGINNLTPSHKLDIDNGEARINRGNSSGDILILRGQNSEQAKFDTDGLKFNGDTAAANALDDYEEGTWTPASGSNFGAFTNAAGHYVKVGRIVNLTFQFNYASVVLDTAQILGLPFAAAAQNPNTGINSTGLVYETDKIFIVWAEESTTAQASVHANRPLYGSASTGAGFIRGSLTYQTND